MKYKVGKRRNIYKIFQLIVIFFIGICLWGFVSELFDTEPSNTSFFPLIFIGLSYCILALVHNSQDYNIIAEKVKKDTGIDPRDLINQDEEESTEQECEEQNKADGSSEK